MNETLTVARPGNESALTGRVYDISNQSVRVTFCSDTDLKQGDQVKCTLAREGTYTTVVADVEEISGRDCVFSLLVNSIEQGIERAPRVVTPGTTVTMEHGDLTIVGSLCDVSESGLRIRSLGKFEVGQDLKLSMATELGGICFSGKIARVVPGIENDSSDTGIQITEISKLDRARFNHFVDGLLRKAKKAS